MDLLNKIDCFLLDMDGTVYLGDKLIPGAADFIQLLENKNIEYVFLTNNSSRHSGDYQQKLKKMGFNVKKEDIINSGQVMADYIQKQKPEAAVYVVGTSSLKEEFTGFNLRVVDENYSRPDYLVVGFDTSLNYKKLWTAHDLILQGITYYATNPDDVCPLPGGKSMPDCGSIIQLLKTSTGQEPEIIAGKPNSLMIEYVSTLKNISKENMAMIGDRQYTDIKMAVEAGITGILVLSGETKKSDLKNSDASQKPDFVFKSLKDIVANEQNI